MNRTSIRSALTATGVGMALLLAGCGSGGSDSAAGAKSLTTVADSTTSSQTRTDSGTSSSSTAGSASSASDTSSAPPTSASKRAATAPPAAKRSKTKPPVKPSIHPSAGDKPVPLCTVGQLHITVGGGNADMQGAHRSLRFTNIGDKTCKLTGAPGVSYRSAARGGHQIGLPAHRIIGHQPIVLIPNAIGSAGIFISSAPRKSGCAKVTARGIRVYPPDSYKAAFVPMPEVVCASATSGPYLKVGPILPGPNHTV